MINNSEEVVQGLASLVKSCIEKCRLSFDKVGKQVQDYEQKIKQLSDEKDRIFKEWQYLHKQGANIAYNVWVNS